MHQTLRIIEGNNQTATGCKEQEKQATKNLGHIVLDAVLIGFSILGMATAAWFCWFL